MLDALVLSYVLTFASLSEPERRFLNAVVTAESLSRYRPSPEEEARRTLEELVRLNENPSPRPRARAYSPLPPRRPVDIPARKP